MRSINVPISPWEKRFFRLVSKVAFGSYRRIPLFGALRASVGVIRDGDLFLAIARNDDQGYSFPGGIALPWENDEQVLTREIHEETGMSVSHYEFVSRYFSSLEVPCNISVFRVQASGRMCDSWEGTPVWVGLPQLRGRITRSQRHIVENLLNSL